MTRMNRRDYLALIGAAGAGFAIGSACKSGSDQTNRQNPAAAVTPIMKPEKPRTWSKRWLDPFPTNPPPEQTIKLIFYGLSSLTPGTQGNKSYCDVGFHSSGDSSHHHQLSVVTYDGSPGSCTSVYDSTKPPEQIAKLELKVDQPDGRFQEVSFYQSGEVQRRAELSDEKDFRWIIDFESDYLYRNFPGSAHPNKLTKVPFIYSPVLTVPYGLFYTLRKTASTFTAKTDNGQYVSNLGNVADVMAVNIYVKPNTGLTLLVNTKPHPVKAPGEVYFINTCSKPGSGQHCEVDPSSTDEALRSDFYLHYKGFERDQMPKYGLWLDQTHSQTAKPDICDLGQITPREMSLTDEAPCAAAGYGGGH